MAEGAAPTIAQRIEASARAVESYLAAYKAELEVRDALVVEACNDGLPWRDIARWAHLTMPRVNQIIARRMAPA